MGQAQSHGDVKATSRRTERLQGVCHRRLVGFAVAGRPKAKRRDSHFSDEAAATLTRLRIYGGGLVAHVPYRTSAGS
jgi:hypothetical protein